jgi:hypothetical protein
MPCGPTHDRFHAKYTVNTLAAAAGAGGGGGGGGGAGAGTGAHDAITSSAQRATARFIGFLRQLSNGTI